ncbi:aminotransferase class V-fold PLP-dependent enzyme [Wenyingzhuangia sp. IMCC45533]
MNQKIYLSPPHLKGNERELLLKTMESNWIAPQGPMLALFEQKVADFVGSKYVLALNSATAAIHLGLQVLGISKGDKVLCANFSFIASVNPITYLGAIPVLVDSESTTHNMCPVLLEKAITNEIKNGEKPKAMVLVHGYGIPAKIDEILAITKKYNILVLEDAASALGARYRNQCCGTFGDLGVFSFNGNKIVTTSGGGVLISNREEYIKKARYLATQAKENGTDNQHHQIGYNYRLSNVLAAIGVAQMELLNDFISLRKRNYEFYKKNLSNDDISFLGAETVAESNYWLTSVIFKTNNIKEKVREALKEEGIESRNLWKPIHQQVAYQNTVVYTNGISEDLFGRGLSLPSGSSLSLHDLDKICEIVKKSV